MALTLGLATAASAAFTDFTDVKGHWAEKTLSQAYQDKILMGYDTKTMAPDSSVTTAQAVTILCRVFHVTGLGDTSALEIPQGAWYAQDVAKAVYAGLLDESAAGSLDQPISRGDAFLLFGRAFQVVGAQPDLSVLEQFPRRGLPHRGTRPDRCCAGGKGHCLRQPGEVGAGPFPHPGGFATILYRMVDQYIAAGSYTGHTGAGSVLSGDAVMSNVKAGDVWLDHSASRVVLSDVSANAMTIRSDNLTALSLYGQGTIGRLVLAARTGDADLELPETYSLGTLVVGDGTGQVSFSGTASNLEVTGSGRTIHLHSSLDALVVSGSDNVISVDRGCALGQITVLGTGNTLKLDGKADSLLLSGRDNTVSGSGRVTDVTLHTRYYTLTVSKNSLTKWTGYDIKKGSRGTGCP